MRQTGLPDTLAGCAMPVKVSGSPTRHVMRDCRRSDRGGVLRVEFMRLPPIRQFRHARPPLRASISGNALFDCEAFGERVVCHGQTSRVVVARALRTCLCRLPRSGPPYLLFVVRFGLFVRNDGVKRARSVVLLPRSVACVGERYEAVAGQFSVDVYDGVQYLAPFFVYPALEKVQPVSEFRLAKRRAAVFQRLDGIRFVVSARNTATEIPVRTSTPGPFP